MTGLEGETSIVGGFLLAGEVAYLGFLAVKRNYVKCSASFAVTPPDGRYLTPPPAETQAIAAASPPKPAGWEKRQRDPKTGQFLPEPQPLREASLCLA